MQNKKTFSIRLLAVFAVSTVATFWIAAQTPAVPSLISAPVDETRLAVLTGNTHPLAQPQFDRGLAAGSLPLDHMLLVLKRSPDQEAALAKLLAEQQERTSPNYHKWLTPDEFGAQFGASDQDIQKITSWLQSHGFQVNSTIRGRNMIDFSGTAAQVQSAFHTAIHRYLLDNGEEHWANANDPAIPTALAAVVSGVRSLNNFFPKPPHHMAPAIKARTSGTIRPQFTFPSGCTTVTSTNQALDCQFGIGPADFAKIYSVPSNLTGSGETIAIVSGSDVVATDLTQFRGQFGLPSITINAANSTTCAVAPCFTQIDPNIDPGVVGPTVNNGNFGDEDEIEAILDVEWAGAVAPGANLDLVASADTGVSAGIDLSAVYIVNQGLSLAPILSESYGICELQAGTTGAAFYNNLWSQAASEGITVIVAAGDNGSAACDTEEANGNPAQPALAGLQVSAIASTPFDIAVGATDFNDITNPFTFFANGTGNNATTQLSALSYIPETTWNDSCTNSVLINFLALTTAAAACNSVTGQTDGFVIPIGGSGGRSNCTTSNGVSPSSCTGGYAKPLWQVGPGVPEDGKRDIPDLSLFGGDGFISGSFYIDCEADLPNANNQPTGPCNLANEDFGGFGGTSVSAQAFAGIMALIDQSTKSAQGNMNPTFYAVAAAQSPSACASSASSISCAFNDVIVGTNAMPCQAQKTTTELIVSPNCPVNSSGPIGILTDPTNNQFAFNATAGFDLATGLGTPNVTALLSKLGPTFFITPSSETVTVSQGSSQVVTLTVTAVNLTSGSLVVSGFQCPVLPSLATCTFATAPATSPTSVTLTPGTLSQTVTMTVTTAPSTAFLPGWRLQNPGSWTSGELVALGCIACAGAVFIGLRGRQRRWSAAFAAIAFATIVSCAGCGGSSSSSSSGGGGGGTGGTPKGTTTAVVTATSGTTTTTVDFTLTVD